MYGKLAKSDKEKALVGYSRQFEAFEKIIPVELTQKEWEGIKERTATGKNERSVILSPEGTKDLALRFFAPEGAQNDNAALSRNDSQAFDIGQTLSFIQRELKDRAPQISEADIAALGAAKTHAERFYELAEKRNEVFARKITSAMERSRQNVSVIVVGGFHEKGLKTVLEAKGISTAVISPKMGEALSDIPYMERMTGKPVELEKLIEQARQASSTLERPLNISPKMVSPADREEAYSALREVAAEILRGRRGLSEVYDRGGAIGAGPNRGASRRPSPKQSLLYLLQGPLAQPPFLAEGYTKILPTASAKIAAAIVVFIGKLNAAKKLLAKAAATEMHNRLLNIPAVNVLFASSNIMAVAPVSFVAGYSIINLIKVNKKLTINENRAEMRYIENGTEANIKSASLSSRIGFRPDARAELRMAELTLDELKKAVEAQFGSDSSRTGLRVFVYNIPTNRFGVTINLRKESTTPTISTVETKLNLLGSSISRKYPKQYKAIITKTAGDAKTDVRVLTFSPQPITVPAATQPAKGSTDEKKENFRSELRTDKPDSARLALKQGSKSAVEFRAHLDEYERYFIDGKRIPSEKREALKEKIDSYAQKVATLRNEKDLQKIMEGFSEILRQALFDMRSEE